LATVNFASSDHSLKPVTVPIAVSTAFMADWKSIGLGYLTNFDTKSLKSYLSTSLNIQNIQLF
jgi:hypothetical protein